LDCIPRVILDSQPAEVHAFRVDVSNSGVYCIGTTVNNGSPSVRKWEKTLSEVLCEIPLTNPNEVPSQIRPSLNGAGIVLLPIVWALCYENNSTVLRVYRRGCELVEIRSWERSKPVIWKPAPDLDAQEKVLDRLLPLQHLDKTATSEAHRAVLLFGASEYDRLAAATRLPERQRALAAKADQLRELAKLPETPGPNASSN
jgi:hypothetical protein